jgi:hypothetical protein
MYPSAKVGPQTSSAYVSPQMFLHKYRNTLNTHKGLEAKLRGEKKHYEVKNTIHSSKQIYDVPALVERCLAFVIENGM